MNVYASIKDLSKLTGLHFTTEEITRVNFLLKYASLTIRRAYERYGTSEAERQTEDDTLARKQVCCWIVKRVLDTEDYNNIASTSATVGSFSESFTFANPDGSVYMRKSDFNALGLFRGRCHSAETI